MNIPTTSTLESAQRNQSFRGGTVTYEAVSAQLGRSQGQVSLVLTNDGEPTGVYVVEDDDTQRFVPWNRIQDIRYSGSDQHWSDL